MLRNAQRFIHQPLAFIGGEGPTLLNINTLTFKQRYMKHKRLKLSGLLLFGLGLTGLQAQTMYVKEKSGTQTAFSLSNVRKMTFSGGNATVHKTDNSTGVYALSGLRYLNFMDLTTEILETKLELNYSNFRIFPNPVIDVLNIDLTGVKGEGTISILTLEGKLLQTQRVKGNSIITLKLIHQSQGIYLCRYSSAEEIKTVKIIKK